MITKNLNFTVKDVDLENMTFSGYASTFGNVDSDGDIIEKEAFPANKIKILMHHDQKNPVGLPVEMFEDDKGLFVKGRISNTASGRDAFTLVKDKVIDSMSVGMTLFADKIGFDENGRRIIKEAALREFSLVAFPANEQALILAAKNLKEIAMRTKCDDAEELLTEMESIKALLKGEPLDSTHPEGQPPVLNEDDLIKELGDFARIIKGE